MKITYETLKKLEDIAVGEVFGLNGYTYIKTNATYRLGTDELLIRCVDIERGFIEGISPNRKVTPINDAEVVIR